MIRAGKGDVESARGLFWRAYNAGLHWVLPQIAELHERNGDLRRAERIYRQCIEDRTSHFTAVSGIVHIYEKTGRHEQAEALAMTAPKHTVPDLARLRAERGDRDGAERLLDALVNAGHLDALVQIARIREHAGDIDGAELMLLRARDAGVRGAQGTLKDLHQQRNAPEARPGTVTTQY